MDENVKIIVSATDKASDKLKNIGKTGKTTFTELSSVIGLANRAWGAAQGFIRDTAGEVVNYANQVRSLTIAIGATPQEASKLIQVADDMGISFEQMNSALEAGIRKGIKPTIENIAALSDQYLALAPGVERTEFLMSKFGRTGQDLARLMELGSGKIAEMGEEIEGTARLMDQDALDAAEDYRLALDALGDAATDLKIGIGRGLIPELNKVADVMTRNIKITQILNEAEDLGLITSLERTRAGSFLFGSEEANMRQVEEIAEKLEAYNKRMNDAAMSSRGLGRATGEQTNALRELETPLENVSKRLFGFPDIVMKSVKPMYDAAAAAEEARAKFNAWKDTLKPTVSVLDQLNNMNMNFGDTIKDQIDKLKWDQAGGGTIQGVSDTINWALLAGKITKPQADEMLGELLVASDSLAAEINGTDFNTLAQNLADDLHVPLDVAAQKATAAIDAIRAGELETFVYKIQLEYITPTLPTPTLSPFAPVKQNPKPKSDAVGGYIPVGAHVINENSSTAPETFVSGGGRVLTKQDAMAALGGATINIYPLPGQDENAIAARVLAMLSRGNSRSRGGMGYAGI